MSYTDHDVLERLASTEGQAAARSLREQFTAPAASVCDACGGALDPVDEVGRFRHRSCAPPAIPESVRRQIEALRRGREGGR